MTEHLLVSLASVVVLGIGAQWLAWRLRLPSILILLLTGFLVGPVTGFLHPTELLGELLFPVVSMSVAVILFEGGLSLKLSELRQIGNVFRNLVTVGALVTWVLSAGAAYLILDLDLALASLLGAILVVTGPTVIIPLLNHIRPVGQIGSILKWEGIVIDPIGATLAVLVFEAVLAGEFGAAAGVVVLGVLKTIVIGSVLGLLGAGLIILLLRRYWVPDFLQNPVTLMVVVGVFTASNMLQAESGLLTVTVMGVVLANQKQASIQHIIEFKENLRTLLLAFLFILLAARLQQSDLAQISWSGLIFVAMLILIVRPLAVLLSTLGSTLNWPERALLAWLAPRGIVAAAVASIFALELSEIGHPHAEQLAPLTFLVIVCTVAIYGLTAGPLAHRLGVAQQNPQGILFVGAHALARAIGRVLRAEGYRVCFIDTNWSNVSAARLDGLSTCYGNVLFEETLYGIDLVGVGRLLALTSNDEANSLAAIHFAETFGRSEVYQLPLRSGNGANGNGEVAPPHLRGRLLFGPNITYNYLMERFAAGASIKVTTLTQEFDYRAFKTLYGGTAIPLFVVDELRNLTIATVDEPLSPRPGQALVSLVGPIASEQKKD